MQCICTSRQRRRRELTEHGSSKLPVNPAHNEHSTAQGFHGETFPQVSRERPFAPGLAPGYTPEQGWMDGEPKTSESDWMRSHLSDPPGGVPRKICQRPV